MKESVLGHIVVCPVCKKAYIPAVDVCNCPDEPMYGKEIEDDEKGNGRTDHRSGRAG